MQDYFGKKGHQIICNKPCELIIHRQNVVETPDGDLDTFMFGTLLLVHNGSKLEPFTVTLATKVVIPIYSSEQITKNDDDVHLTIHFEEGDVFIKHDEVPANIRNVYDLFNNVLSGRLSDSIPYYKYYKILLNCMELNHKLSFPRVLLEIMIGELFLDSRGKPVRLTPGAHGKSASVDDLVQTKNTFNSITFNDPTKAALISMGRSKEEQQKNPSPLELYFRK